MQNGDFLSEYIYGRFQSKDNLKSMVLSWRFELYFIFGGVDFP